MTPLLRAKVVLFVSLSTPTVQMAMVASSSQGIGTHAQTILEASGAWSMWLLIAVLAIRPATQIFNLPVLVRFRRMVGLFAAYYAAIHTGAYVASSDFDWLFVFSEIAAHPFLSTGTAAVILLIPLVATSTDAMVRLLGGRRWRRLQRLVYLVLVIAVVHYVLSVRLSPTVPILQAGLLGWLLHYRLIVFRRRERGLALNMRAGTLLWTGIVWAILTGGLELLFFAVNTTIDLGRVLASYVDPAGGLRPATMLALALGFVAAAKWGWDRFTSRS